MSRSVIGAMRANMGLNSAQFSRGIQQVRANMTGLQRTFHDTGLAMQRVGRQLTTRITLPIAGVATAMAATGIRAAEEIDRLSARANAGTREFQRFAAGAETVGIEQEKLSDILLDMNDRIGDFIATGGGPMADFFENIAPQVGVTAEQFARLSGPEALQLYVSSLEQAGLSQQQMTFYMEAIASDATALIPLLASNGAEMERLGDRAEELGAIMDDRTIKALTNAREAFRDVTRAGLGLRNRVLAAMAPMLERLAEVLVNVSTAFSRMSPEMQRTIVVVTALAAAIGPVLTVLGLMATALAAISLPIVAVVAGLTAVAAAAFAIYRSWNSIVAWFQDIFKNLEAAVSGWRDSAVEWGRGLLQGIGDGIRAAGDLVRQAFADLWQVILTALAGWRDQMLETGRNLVRGLVDGLRAGQPEAGQAATRLLRGTIGAAEREAEIQSPSRVFRRLGAFLSEGLALGIGDGAVRAQEAMRGVVDGVAAEGDRLSDVMSTMSSQAQSFGQSFASIVGPVVRGTQTIGDAFRQMGKRMADNAVTSGLQMLGTGLGQVFGLGGGKGGGFLGSLFGGFRAAGGPVSAGRAYVVGEKQPELFVPGMSGTILPSLNAPGGGGGVGQVAQAAVRVFVDDTGRLRAIAEQSGAVGGARAAVEIIERTEERRALSEARPA